MTERLEFAHALSGKPEAVKGYTQKVLNGYIIRDTMGFLFSTSSYVVLNKWRKIEQETELFWIIVETQNPYFEVRFIFYKHSDAAEAAVEELIERHKYKGT